MKQLLRVTRAALLLAGSSLTGTAAPYAILHSESTAADPDWKPVVAALSDKYPGATVITYPDGKPGAALDALRKARPRHACFVTPSIDASREFVTQVHQLTRRIDEDPYVDVIWGILTGHDPANALAIARTKAPLTVERVASGTEVELDACMEGVWYCELQKHRMVRKEAGGDPVQSKGPADTTRALANTLTNDKAQLFITSGHATERDWQIGFRYKNGYFVSKNGQLFGRDTAKNQFPITAPETKIYMPIGNCLVGHIDGPDAMALAWMNSAGVHQMLGYTVPTWYGYAGWGCLDYFVEQPGRYTFAEAVFANHNALSHRLETNFPELARLPLGKPDDAMKLRSKVGVSDTARKNGLRAQDGIGLLFDRDALAFYGDPAWQARMAPGKRAYEQTLSETDGTHTFTIKPLLGTKSFDPVNTNGSQRGGRPFVAWFPKRLDNITIVAGSELQPVITDDFILVPNPGKCDPDREYKVVFKAED